MVCFCLSQGRIFGLLVPTPKHKRNKYTQYLCMKYAVCYSDILNRIRTGNQTNEDKARLHTRLTSGIPDPVQLNDPKFHSALYLLPRKEQVEEYNMQCLLELSRTNPVYEFKAEHCILESRHGVTSRTVPEHLIPTDDNS